jgi:hypothetical protein
MGVFSSLKSLLYSKKENKKASLSRASTNVSEREILVTVSDLSSLKVSTSNVISSSSSERNSSDISSFRFKDGRRYHSDTTVSYVLPSDDDGMQ